MCCSSAAPELCTVDQPWRVDEQLCPAAVPVVLYGQDDELLHHIVTFGLWHVHSVVQSVHTRQW